MIKKLLKLFKDDKTKCKICNKKMKEGETIMKRKCGHKFHEDCVYFYANKYGAFACWKCGEVN